MIVLNFEFIYFLMTFISLFIAGYALFKKEPKWGLSAISMICALFFFILIMHHNLVISEKMLEAKTKIKQAQVVGEKLSTFKNCFE